MVIKRIPARESKCSFSMLFFLKSSEDKSVFSEPTYLDSGRMFDHAEILNVIFTLFTGEIVIHA